MQEGVGLMRAIEIIRNDESECLNCNFQRAKYKAFRKSKLPYRIKNIGRDDTLLRDSKIVLDQTYALLNVSVLEKFCLEAQAGKPRRSRNFWKNITLATPWILKWKNRKIRPFNLKIQEVDGGFFERFGSLLRESSVKAQEEESLEKRRVAKEASSIIQSLSEDAEKEVVTDGDQNGSIDELLLSSDSDPGDAEEKAALFIFSLNIDELYSEILYEIIHNVGFEKNVETGQAALFSYVQDAFKISNDKHKTLLKEAQERKPPEILLNVEVIEAKELMAKDSNGLSDPFVTLFLNSNTSRRYTTSVKLGTLNPVWEEHFALPVKDINAEDFLCLEVWDFDPAETVGEKFSKIFQVKGVKGAKKLLKEIAVTATAGQHKNELVGTAKIPLQNIPAVGMNMWYRLDKKGKCGNTRRGVVKLHIAFGSEKDGQVALQEHKHIVHALLLHELDLLKASSYSWNGYFRAQPQEILTQHRVLSGLSAKDVALSAWTVYSNIHKEHPLNFTVFNSLLESLLKPLSSPTVTEDDLKSFWEASKKLLPTCFSIVRKIRKRSSNEKSAAQQLMEVLKIIAKLEALGPPENFDLFPASLYTWSSHKGEGPNNNIAATLKDAVVNGGQNWFKFLLQNNQKQDDTAEESLIYLNKIIQLVRTDLQKAVEFYDKIFQEITNLQYAVTLYDVYQTEANNLMGPEIVTICKSLKQISYESSCVTASDANEPLSLGTKLFELYLALQRFVVLGKGLCPTDYDSFEIKNFHKWFHGGVAQWLDIAVFKALQRIEKAVELDNLKPVDDTVKYSTSALDTLTIFHQIKIFWDQLNWPDVEGSYTFVAKIIDDICRCCVFYADKVDSKVEGMGDMQNSYEKRFDVTQEWCFAINNIDYVCQSLKPFSEQLDLENLLQKLVDIRGPVEAQRCRETLANVLENSIDTVRNKIIELLEIVATKMKPAMKKLLIEGAELLHQDSNSIDKVMRYLDQNLETLHTELNSDNFERTLEIIWDYLGHILTDLIQSNIEKRRPPSFFANLRETLQLMVKSFKQSDITSDCDSLKRIDYLLKINGMETSELIHQIHLDRWNVQKELDNTPYGEIAVRMQFINNDLKVELINARNLIAMDSNGFSDSYVRIVLLPEEKFTTVPKPKTQTHSKNLFPLYDETFILNLTPQQRQTRDALVLFIVRDKDFLGMSNQLIGEAFVNFEEVLETSDDISTLSQIRLVLSRPNDLTTDAIKALENRQGDKLAKEFMKKLKSKNVPA